MVSELPFPAQSTQGEVAASNKYSMRFTTSINQPCPELAKFHSTWRKTRAFVEGEDAVKAMGETLLPRIRADDGDTFYATHKANTNLYPAVTKIAQGVLGLIQRKPAQFACDSARVQLLAHSITPRGLSLETLAEEVVRETLITNFTGLLVDHPPRGQFSNLNAANADLKGYRPRVSLYQGESILEVVEGPVGANHQIILVRLLEHNGSRVRKLFINDQGQYEQHIYVADDTGQFGTEPSSTSVPMIDGKPMTEIPFVIVSSTDKCHPTPSLLKSAVDVNLQHYRLSGLLANMTWMTSGPIITAIGFNRETYTNDKGVKQEVDPEWDFSPNAVVEIKDKDVKLDYFIFDPKGASLVQGQLEDKRTELSVIGHSILAPEKAAPEAPETIMLRRVAENATLAGFTRAISRKLEKAVQLFALWVDGSEATFSLNTDFQPNGLSPQAHKELRDDWLNGAITHETYLYALRDGEVVSPVLIPEDEAERAKAEFNDRPTLATGF